MLANQGKGIPLAYMRTLPNVPRNHLQYSNKSGRWPAFFSMSQVSQPGPIVDAPKHQYSEHWFV